MRSYLAVVTCVVGVLVFCGQAHGVFGPAFSLDDNPAQPITSPPGTMPGFGAEDPFGLFLFGGSLAPSPTLPAVPAMDADILRPSPAGGPTPIIDVPMSQMYQQPFGYVDAVSDNSAIGHPVSPVIHLGFSVDRISLGQAGTAVAWQAGLAQQPGDIFRTDPAYQHPMFFVGTPGLGGYNGPLPTAGLMGTNFLVVDESAMNLTAGNGVGTLVGPTIPCPAISSGTHDNVDAANWQEFDVNPMDQITDRDLFFSVAPDEAFINGFQPADIYVVQAGTPAGVALSYASAPQMGLMNFGVQESDDIDALVVWDSLNGQPGRADSQIDYALFSLSAGSISLLQYGLSPSDVFFTDFSGGFWLYASGMDLGLLAGPDGENDNVDALEVMVPGDANLDGKVDLNDFIILKTNFLSGTTWMQGDYDGNGTVNLTDFVILKTNFTFTEGASEPIPEPASLVLMLLGAAAAMRRRR